ncbi:C-type lectin domain family 10 member A-like isoform X2 [Pseudophryne corroboree]|uniref:C-type lectin domain family 10 member A-like isoform X2 n=1 Tax=Pseudophryne corroboree TaxID=495146 RepID=UPI003081531F
MGMDDRDFEQLTANDNREVSRMSRWCQQPFSSRLLGLLLCMCVALISLNIIITVTSRDFHEKELEKLLASQICDPDGRSNDERQYDQDGAVFQKQLPGISDNDTYDGPCPDDWHQFKDSCYYFSNLAKSWQQSQNACQWRNARLVAINTKEEQVFVTQLAMRTRAWIGLSESDGEWKWVDGTPYSSSPKNWGTNQPDEYFGHGLGGGEDCAQLHYNGEWNDEHCSRAYRFICEKKAK